MFKNIRIKSKNMETDPMEPWWVMSKSSLVTLIKNKHIFKYWIFAEK